MDAVSKRGGKKFPENLEFQRSGFLEVDVGGPCEAPALCHTPLEASEEVVGQVVCSWHPGPLPRYVLAIPIESPALAAVSTHLVEVPQHLAGTAGRASTKAVGTRICAMKFVVDVGSHMAVG